MWKFSTKNKMWKFSTKNKMWKFSTKIKMWKFDRKKKVEILHKNKKVGQKESLRKSSKTLLDALVNIQFKTTDYGTPSKQSRGWWS